MLCSTLRKARTTNQTSNGYVANIPRFAEPGPSGFEDAGTPTGESIIDLAGGTSMGPDSMIILPYGIGSDNNTFSMRILGWKPAGTGPSRLWIPITLLEVLCTLSSTVPGVASGFILNTELFCDTIAIVGTAGNPNISCEIISPADNTIAHLLVNFKGCPKIEMTFTTGASATSCNALFAIL